MENPMSGLTLATLPEDVLHLIAAQLYQVGSPADLYSLHLSLVRPATSRDTSLAIASRIIRPWLYRKIDLDFAGAEIVRTTQLLKCLFDDALDVRKYVRQITVIMGPLVAKRDGTHAGMKRLSFTLCHALSPSLRPYWLQNNSVRSDPLHVDAVTTASVEKLQADDLLVYRTLKKILHADKNGVAASKERMTVPSAKRPPMPITSPTVEKLWLEGFPFGCSGDFRQLCHRIDFSKLKFLELRNCSNVRLLLDYLVEERRPINLKIIRVVAPQKDNRVKVATTLHAYGRFFCVNRGFEEVVIDDHPLCPLLITDMGGPNLRRLELHFPKSDLPYEHPFLEPAVVDTTRALSRNADTVELIRHFCPNLTDLHIDMQQGEIQHGTAIITALQRQRCIKYLSISLSQSETVDAAEAERIANIIRSKPLRRLNIHHRPHIYPYLTSWDRFGRDEPWPLRTPEEVASTVHGNNRVGFGLGWTAHYLEEAHTVMAIGR
ncbi:MAG: hypothetical protein Q9216_006012 [Gyalolechia sp. 2 TL-2023]